MQGEDKGVKIAIIDDEQSARSVLSEYLARYSEENHCLFETESYQSGTEFLESYECGYDVLFFDVEMPGMNGLDTAREIRKKDKRCVILFITNIAQYAIQGYEVEAIDYVLKPVTYPDFSMKMKKALRFVALNTESYLSVEGIDGLHRLEISTIDYVEVLSHMVIYHVGKTEIKARGNMRDVEKTLILHQFSRIYKSYLVNLKRIKTVHAAEVELSSGVVLPIGRVYKKDFMQQFMDFMQG